MEPKGRFGRAFLAVASSAQRSVGGRAASNRRDEFPGEVVGSKLQTWGDTRVSVQNQRKRGAAGCSPSGTIGLGCSLKQWLETPAWGGGGGFLCLRRTPSGCGVCLWLITWSLAGHRGSAAARVFKLFRSEHGEYFNVSSSSEWVQGEAFGAPGEAQRLGQRPGCTVG